MRSVAMGAITWLLLGGLSAYGETLVVPADLAKYAARQGCRQVTDFFDRPGIIDPPYVYGYSAGAREESAVFWCEVRRGGERVFWLLVSGKEGAPSGCPRKIEWSNYPGGLSISSVSDAKPEHFVYVSEWGAPRRKLPAGISLTGNAIRSEYDGVSALFYCYKGEWVVRFRH